MRITKRLSCALAALTTLALAPVAMAQDGPPDGPPPPPNVVERCLGAMQTSAERSIDQIAQTTRRGVRVINELGENEAPNAAIVRAGHEANSRIRGAARRGALRIDAIFNECFVALRRLGAPQEAFEAIARGRAMAKGAIGEAAQRGQRAVREAVEENLSDEEDEDGEGSATSPLSSAA